MLREHKKGKQACAVQIHHGKAKDFVISDGDPCARGATHCLCDGVWGDARGLQFLGSHDVLPYGGSDFKHAAHIRDGGSPNMVRVALGIHHLILELLENDAISRGSPREAEQAGVFGFGFRHLPMIAGVSIFNDPIGARQMGSTQLECSG